MLETFLIFLVIVLFIIAFAGIILPFLPGLPLAWLGIILYAIFSPTHSISLNVIVATGLIVLVSLIFDLISNIVGAKMLGSSIYGIIGAIIGTIIGFFISAFLGIIIGAFLGAFLGEYIKTTDYKKSLKASVGTLIGFAMSSILNIALLALMIAIFVKAVV